MPPLAVVKAFDVAKNLALSFNAGTEGGAVNQFSFQGSEKRLGDSVIIAAAGAAHALKPARSFQ